MSVVTVIDKEYECIYSCSLFTDCSGELSSIKSETVFIFKLTVANQKAAT
jgi:hypothetical protein